MEKTVSTGVVNYFYVFMSIYMVMLIEINPLSPKIGCVLTCIYLVPLSTGQFFPLICLHSMLWMLLHYGYDLLGFKLRVSNVGSPACDNNV